MGMEGPKQMPPNPAEEEQKEGGEKPTYKIVELESQATGFDTQREQARASMKSREISMDAFGGKLKEIDDAEKIVKAELAKEKEGIIPEDQNLLANIQQEQESIKFHEEGFKGAHKRFKEMRNWDGKGPRPDVDKNEYDQLQKELIQMDTDIKNKKRELTKMMEDPIKRGLISK